MTKQKNLFLVSLLILMIAGLTLLLSEEPEATYADTDSPDTTWEATHQEISSGAPYAIRPAIAAAPNGDTVLVVYSSATSVGANQNIYYSFSTKNGESGKWTYHKRLNNSGVPSSTPNVTFDKNNIAHMVWREDFGTAYARSVSNNLSDGFTTPTVFPNAPTTDPGAENPQVITYGNHVHIIWIEGDFSSSDFARRERNIYHRHSTNSGSSWGTTLNTPQKITYSEVKHITPAVTVDANGNLHVVYGTQFYVGLTILEHIQYVKGALDGGSITWPDETTHTDITTNMTAGAPNFDVLEPDILFANGNLDVSVTQRYLAASGNQKQQYIYYLGCASACNNESSWSATRVSNTALYVDVSPYSLASSIVRFGGCINITFDGKTNPSSAYSEQIFQTSGCSNWGDNLKELTLNDESRTILPDSTSQSNWWSYIVYEEFVGVASDANKQVIFTRNRPAQYFPAMLKK